MAYRGTLPEVPSFGTALARGLGEGVNQAISSSQKFAEKIRFEREKQKQLYETLGQLGGDPMEGGSAKWSKLSPAQRAVFAERFPDAAKTLQKDEELEEARGEKRKAERRGVDALDRMEQLAGDPGIGLLGTTNMTPEARRNRGEFKALQLSLLSLLKTLTPRGITQEEFKIYVKNYIPNSWDTEETVRGKLQGFRNLVSEQETERREESEKEEMATNSQTSRKERKPSASSSRETVRMKTPDGKVVNVPKHRVKEAMAAGGEVVR